MTGRIPGFLIVGAPKSGTTSLYRYLQQHPQIYMPENKEPRFFCNYPVETFEFGTKQFHPNIVTSPEDYLSLFKDAPESALCGEASTDYLSCSGAAARIRAWNREMKIIILLRNPVERAYSEYRHSRAANFQNHSFWESLCLEDERFRERYDPIFSHVRRGLYFNAVSEYIENLGKTNVMVLLFEDFVRSTRLVVESSFEFLGLPPCELDVSIRHNAGDTEDTVRDALSEEQYSWLKNEFRDDVKDLQHLLQTDLSHWL